MHESKSSSTTDEINLKDLILQAQIYIRELFKYWWIIAIFCIVSASISMYSHYNTEVRYNADLRFVVEGQSGSGGLSNLLGSFGIKKSGKVNPYKILEVAKSTKLFLNILSSKDEQGIILGNRILDQYQLIEKWGLGNEKLNDFVFKNQPITIEDDIVEQEVIKRLMSFVWGSSSKKDNSLTTINLKDDTGIYTLSTNSKFENISLDLTQNIYKEVKNFFEEEVFMNQKQLVDILSAKADSVKNLRNSQIRKLARFDDLNRGLIKKSALVERSIIIQEQLALSNVYAEVMKNSEMTDVNLKDSQPFFMAIDTPFRPLLPIGSSLVLSLFLGLLIGGIISVLIILIRKIYNDVMSS